MGVTFGSISHCYTSGWRKALVGWLLASLLAGCGGAPPGGAQPRATAPLPSAVAHRVSAMPTPRPLPSPTASLIPLPSPTAYPPVEQDAWTITSQRMGGMQRNLSVYLPGEYFQQPQKRFPVVVAFDGQELPLIVFEQYLNTLFISGQVEPLIVVAIQAADGDARLQELGTGPTLNLFGWGTMSDAFNKFVIYELLPAVEARYRTLPGPQNTAVMGWSLGGLAAFYLGWQYSEQIGVVGAFSPSLWWRSESKPGLELEARVIHNLVRSSPARAGLRVWLEAGNAEEPFSDIDQNGVADVIQDVRDLVKLLQSKGYLSENDLKYLEVEGGRHELATWSKVLPDFLHWAFPPQP